MTDGNTHTVYLLESLRGYMFDKVLAHELCHCFCFSYGIDIPIDQEEFMADFISLYGRDLVYLLDDLLQSAFRKYA